MIFIGHSMAADVKRPGANNKMGLTKKTQEEKENSFFNRLIKGDFDEKSTNQDIDIDQMKSDIAELKKGNEYTDSNDKIIKQIKMLSELKDEGVLSNEEFEDKKKVLLNKIK
tara:strand:+ start:319 stop:654 length:336 start_codon:yes stop_codon:yes gene_type:complete